jgi:two-component system, OmpR family, sensor histidine kinase KdpD
VSSRIESDRPSPEALLRAAAQEGRGRLKVFLGAAPGVGKTYEMLTEGAARKKAGTDVVIGIVETHGRAETEALTKGLEIVPRKQVDYQGRALSEMDIDAILARRPSLALVDELAHTNAPGSRHPKRWQDVEELLAAGIDVYSTVNIQHIESLNDVVASFTKVRVRETVPDRVLAEADSIELIDIPPDELIERLKEGKVYIPEEAARALNHFFSKSNLSALRELALRQAAQTVDTQMLDYLRAHALAGTWAAGQRIVVAVNELPGSSGLIRAAKRLADAQRAPWTAVYVETPRSLTFTDQDKQQLAEGLQLARQLGANVASIPAAHVVDGLKAFLEEARATQLVIGKSARSRWFELQHGSVVDRLVRETPGVAVHVLPHGEDTERRSTKAASAPKGSWGQPIGYLVAAVLVAVFTGIAIGVHAFGGLANVALVYLIPVLAAASLYGLRTGVFTGVLSALAYNFFFLPPLYTFTIEDPENFLTLVVFIAVAIVTSQLAARVRVQADLAERSSGQNAALASFARTLAGVATGEELGQTLCGEVSRQFGVDAVLLLPARQGVELTAAVPPDAALGPIDNAAAEWAIDHKQATGRGTGTLAASEWLFQPLLSSSKALGVLGIAKRDSSDPARSDQLPLLLSFTDQAALALERISLSEEMTNVAQLRERDRLREALLSSVSHDLRTPLTTIIAAVSELKKAKRVDPTLLQDIESQSERLSRFVSNLLDMVRVEAGGLQLNREPVDLTEAVASAADDLRQELEGHAVKLAIPPDLPLVRVDPQLFHQCLVNLLENAAKYSGEGMPITVTAQREQEGIALSVIDSGPGLPAGDESRVFETFVRLEGSDRKGGTGLGLAIVKGFAGAMGLQVNARNNEGAPGACFTIRFPGESLVREAAVVE